MPTTTTRPKQLITIRELADILKLSPATIYRMVRARELPAARIGSSIRFDLEQVLEDVTSPRQS